DGGNRARGGTGSGGKPRGKVSAGFVPTPTRKSKKITPISESAPVNSLGATNPSALGPMITPASISPATAGCFSLSKISAASLAATNITKTVKRNWLARARPNVLIISFHQNGAYGTNGTKRSPVRPVSPIRPIPKIDKIMPKVKTRTAIRQSDRLQRIAKTIRETRLMPNYVLALDQGTTSSRAILFDREGRIV